jgi:protein SCO1
MSDRRSDSTMNWSICAAIATQLAATACVLAAPLARADEPTLAHKNVVQDHASRSEASADPHAHHRAMEVPPVARSIVNYVVPDVRLVRSDGARVNLVQELGDGRPVLLDFVYTTCTTICPVLSQTFAEVQKRLGASATKLKMVSVSIDPEEDTPARLTEYAKRYQAGAQWSFYSGPVDAISTVQRAFDIYRGDKMNHTPVTFFRSAPAQPWIRLDGFATPDAVMGEVRTQLARK